jgi:hypothetical protein
MDDIGKMKIVIKAQKVLEWTKNGTMQLIWGKWS